MQEEEGIDVESNDATADHQRHCDGFKVKFAKDVNSWKLDEKADNKSDCLESNYVYPCASNSDL